jgi:dATP pyrophosphohydrolase
MTCSSISPTSINAYVIHSHHNGNMYLILRRSSKYLYGTWQMVSGNIKEGEKAYETALREIREETSLIPNRLYSADTVATFYMHTTDKILLVPIFVAFIDTLKAEVGLSDEHYDYEWASFDVAKERLEFAEQKRIISHIQTNFVLNDPNPIHLIQ